MRFGREHSFGVTWNGRSFVVGGRHAVTRPVIVLRLFSAEYAVAAHNAKSEILSAIVLNSEKRTERESKTINTRNRFINLLSFYLLNHSIYFNSKKETAETTIEMNDEDIFNMMSWVMDHIAFGGHALGGGERVILACGRFDGKKWFDLISGRPRALASSPGFNFRLTKTFFSVYVFTNDCARPIAVPCPTAGIFGGSGTTFEQKSLKPTVRHK